MRVIILTRETVEFTEDKILSILANHRKVSIEAYALGNPQKVEILIDIDLLLKEANLTDRQLQIVELYFIKQLTQDQVAETLGVSQQAVCDQLPIIKRQIKAVAKKWSDQDE